MKSPEIRHLSHLVALFLFFSFFACHSIAQGKTTFGSTNASLCYQESNMPFSDFGLRYCTDAIRNDDLFARDLAATYTNRGIIFAANGKFERAMEDHNQALLLAPDMAKIYVNRGNVHHQIRDYHRALDDYDTAIGLANVELDIVFYNKALSLIRLKQWDAAEDLLEKALELNPNSSRAKQKLKLFQQQTEISNPNIDSSNTSEG